MGRFRPSFPSSLGHCVSACSIQPSTLAGRLVRSKSVTHSGFCSLPLTQTLCSLNEHRVWREAPQGRPTKPVVSYGYSPTPNLVTGNG